MTNIVHLQRPRYHPRTFTTAERMIDELRERIFADGRTYKDIAIATGVERTTINNLATGKTRWPRPTTLFPLIAALGMQLQLVRLGGGE